MTQTQIFEIDGQEYHCGQRVEAKVISIKPSGVLVRLEDGNRGIIRRWELSWDRDLSETDVRTLVSEGSIVSVLVLEPDKNRQYLMLSLKRAKYDPWEELEDKTLIGSIVKGEVVELRPYGAFVELQKPKGIVGLVHLSQIPGHGKDIRELLWVGDLVESVITDIDTERRRLSLSIRERVTESETGNKRKKGKKGKKQEKDAEIDKLGSDQPEMSSHSDEPEATLLRTGKIEEILLVDDDKDFVKSFSSLLKKLDYHVETAITAEEGLHKGVSSKYDLIFLDLHLGDKDGQEIAREILSTRPEARIFIVTGLDWFDRKTSAQDPNLAGILLKPLDSAQVIRMLQALENAEEVQTPTWSTRTMELEDEFFSHILNTRESSEPLDVKLVQLLQGLREATEAEASYIFRMDAISRDTSVLARNSHLLDYEDALHELKYSPVKDVAWERATIFENDVKGHAEARFAYLLKYIYFGSCIAIPLEVSDNSAFYALFLLDSAARHFTEGHMQQTLLTAKAVELTIEQENLMSHIREQQRLVLTGQLGLSLVHEINNRLTGIEQYTKNLQLDCISLTQKPELCHNTAFPKQMKNRTKSILQISKDLRDLNHAYVGLIKQEEYGIVDIASIIHQLRDLMEPMAQKKGVQIELDLGLDVPLTYTIPIRLEQVCLNLLLNAVQQMELATIKRKPSKLQITTRYKQDNPSIEIRFADSGPGIHRQRFGWIFEIGTSTREDGAGLGLFISKGLIESIGGRLSIEDSIMFVGTTFLVELPYVPVEEVA